MPWQGHLEGVKAVGKILEEALGMGIPYFTIWVGSYDNLVKRSKIEVDFLFKLYEKYFSKMAKDKRVHKHEVKINVFGRWKEICPKATKAAMEEAISITKEYNKKVLTVLAAYNGVDEMVDGVKNMEKAFKKTGIEITPDFIKSSLWTKDLPPVDLLIRTGGEPHNSNGFMMWHTADSQYYFTKTFWPDFGTDEFRKAVEEYLKRERRFGA